MVDLGTAEILKMQQITRKKNDKLLAQAVNEAVLKARKPFELEKKRILDERDSKIREIKSSSNEQVRDNKGHDAILTCAISCRLKKEVL